MELDETSHILDHQQASSPTETTSIQVGSGASTSASAPTSTSTTLTSTTASSTTHPNHFPDTPESSKSDLHQLVADDSEQDDKPRSSIPMASFNFINSIIGSGIIGMPFALREAGFGLGILLVILVTVITDYSVVLLIHGGELSNTNCYQDVMRAAFGRPGFVILTIMQFLYPMIAMISYNVIIGDTITKIVRRIGGAHVMNTVLIQREFIICIVTLLITLPLSLCKNVARLSKVSLVSIAFIVFIIGVMIGEGFTMPVPPSPDAWEFANTGITKAIGVMAFTYMCSHNSFLIYDSLSHRTEQNWGRVTHISVGFSMVCTLILGITGYATFTGFSQGDILENFCHEDDWANAARVLFACTIMLTYPIECFVCREVVENAVFAFKQPPPLWRHAVVTVIIVVITVIISMTTDCLGIVLEMNGVINASPLSFIFPALCVMKLSNERIASLSNVPRILLVAFGTVVSAVGFVMIVIELVDGVQCSHGREMPYCYKTDGIVNQSTFDGVSLLPDVSYTTPGT